MAFSVRCGLLLLTVSYSDYFVTLPHCIHKAYSLSCVGTEVSFPLYQQLANDLTEIFKFLVPKKK